MKWMNLTITILDFGIRLYGGSELSKHLSKCLLRLLKTQKIEPGQIFFYDGQKFRMQCVNVIDITWGRIYFSTCEHFGRVFQNPCAMTFSLCNFKDLIYAQSACNTPKRKDNLKLHHMAPLNSGNPVMDFYTCVANLPLSLSVRDSRTVSCPMSKFVCQLLL